MQSEVLCFKFTEKCSLVEVWLRFRSWIIFRREFSITDITAQHRANILVSQVMMMMMLLKTDKGSLQKKKLHKDGTVPSFLRPPHPLGQLGTTQFGTFKYFQTPPPV